MLIKPKVLIISKSKFESSTEDVIDWLWFLGADVERINGDDIESGTFAIPVDRNFLKDDYTGFWFRRWSDNDFINDYLVDANNRERTAAYSGFRDILSDRASIMEFVVSSVNARNKLTTYSQFTVNKLLALRAAQKAGLKIPISEIVFTKSQLITLKQRIGQIIIKDLQNQYSFISNDSISTFYAQECTDEKIASLPDAFYPVIAQQVIEKEFEIRVFYLDGTIEAAAMIPRNTSYSTIDVRESNFEDVKFTKYILSIKERLNIKMLMKYLNMTTGSIDLIRSPTGDLTFLEVNPVGQFGMISFPCNLHLERKIAEFLIR